MIELKNINKSYDLGKVKVPALRGLSLTINAGSFITFIGPSGCGKSTLLNIIGLIDHPTEGMVFIDGIIISTKKEKELTRLRRDKFGFIFQSFNLIPILNVFENVEYPLLYSRIPVKKRKERVQELLDNAGLSGMEKRFPNELSGGQRQRVAIARALVRHPEVLIADEPTANLDSETGSVIVDLIHELNRKQDTTVILATHDQALISRSESVYMICDGRLV